MAKDEQREKRLAEALRANLRKRKESRPLEDTGAKPQTDRE